VKTPDYFAVQEVARQTNYKPTTEDFGK